MHHRLGELFTKLYPNAGRLHCFVCGRHLLAGRLRGPIGFNQLIILLLRDVMLLKIFHVPLLLIFNITNQIDHTLLLRELSLF